MWFMFQVFMIDSVHGGGCLHDAASHGHVDCLKAILFAAHFTAFEDSRLVRLFPHTHTKKTHNNKYGWMQEHTKLWVVMHNCSMDLSGDI